MACRSIGMGMGLEFSGFSDYGLRFLAMVSEKAQPRYRALLFWEKYGLEATDLSQDSESECVERFSRTVQEQFIITMRCKC